MPDRLQISGRLIEAASRFARNVAAASAVEFAIIAPLFLGLIISIVQAGIFFFAQQVLQEAAITASRAILTGQAQQSGMTQTQFVASICPSIQALFTCNNLMVDVQNYASFAAANTGTPTLTYSNGTVSNNWNYNPGVQGQIVVVRLIYAWPLVLSPLSLVTANLPNNAVLMMGIAAFKTEPY